MLHVRFFIKLRDLEEVLKKHDDKLNHLLVLLRTFLFLQDFLEMRYQSFNDFRRQEMSLVGVKLAKQINLHSAFALLIRQLCQLHHQH